MDIKVSRTGALIGVLALVVAACSPGSGGSAPPSPAGSVASSAPASEAPSPTASATGLKAVYVSTGPIGVNPFLQLIADGLKQGGTECGVETKVVESADVATMEDNLAAAVSDGTDLIVANSFDSVDAVTRLAKEHPDQKWAMVDTGIDGQANVRGLVFKEHEGTYLLGAIFGLLASGKYPGYEASSSIGFVGAIDLPFIRRWYVGFEEGVKATNPTAKVLQSWGTGFADPATSKELALAQFDKGAHYIAAVSAAGNTGIFEAAKERGFFTSGVDTDQRPLDPDHIIESMVKRTDLGVKDSVCALAKGTFKGGFVAYGLAERGVGPAFLTLDKLDPPSKLPTEVQDQVRALATKIVSGEIKVTDYLLQAP
jgi:basic membrane protein A